MAYSPAVMGVLIVAAVVASEVCVLTLYLRSKGRKARRPAAKGTKPPPNQPLEINSRTEPASLEKASSPSEPNPFSQLLWKVGLHSKVAGIGFTALAIALLFLSAGTPNMIYEVDSIVAFMAAVILLFRDPRARIQKRVLDAALLSSGRTVGELSVGRPGFTYVPLSGGVQDVVVVPNDSLNYPDGLSNRSNLAGLTPPGRALALLYVREAGLAELTLGEVSSNLPRIVQENFGLADSVEVSMDQERVEVVLKGATGGCGCDTEDKDSNGTIGCVVASFFAVLYTCATRRKVSLERCNRDSASGVCRVVMNILPGSSAGPR